MTKHTEHPDDDYGSISSWIMRSNIQSIVETVLYYVEETESSRAPVNGPDTEVFMLINRWTGHLHH